MRWRIPPGPLVAVVSFLLPVSAVGQGQVIELKPPSTEVIEGSIKQIDRAAGFIVITPNKADKDLAELKVFMKHPFLRRNPPKVFSNTQEGVTVDGLRVGQNVRVTCSADEVVPIVQSVPRDKREVIRVALEIEVRAQDESEQTIQPRSANDDLSDYLTLTLCLLNRGQVRSAELRTVALALLQKHGLSDARLTSAWEVPEEWRAQGFESILTSFGMALHFGATWIDVLPLLIDQRGDFPAISIRSGSVSLRERPSVGIQIREGTEAQVAGAAYVYRKGEWIMP